MALRSPVQPRKEKVFAYVTHGNFLLVFRHTEFPRAGIQVPGGTLHAGEDPVRGVLREVTEETGLRQLEVVRLLGEREVTYPSGPQRLCFYHLRHTGGFDERWTWHEDDPSGGGPPIEFELFWVPLRNVPHLARGHAAFLARLPNRPGSGGL
jgi:8-oxo-dGTP pyrophosphatase MutT (NUDIX family)